MWKELKAQGTECWRQWRDGEHRFDGDLFRQAGGGYVAFVYLKHADQKELPWSETAAKLGAELGEPLTAIGGALKVGDRSEPLPLLWGDGAALADIVTTELGCLYRLELQGVLNPGLFMDQRDNRATLKERISAGAAGPLLNLFSYTGAFSVLAAKAGCPVTSVDLSRRYLEWDRRNHELNGTAALSKRIAADAREYLQRAAKKAARGDEGAGYSWVIIDPPTFSRSDRGPFQVRREMPALVEAALAVQSGPGGILISSNDSRWGRDDFMAEMGDLARAGGVRLEEGLVPLDFEPYSLNSCWLLRNR